MKLDIVPLPGNRHSLLGTSAAMKNQEHIARTSYQLRPGMPLGDLGCVYCGNLQTEWSPITWDIENQEFRERLDEITRDETRRAYTAWLVYLMTSQSVQKELLNLSGYMGDVFRTVELSNKHEAW